MIAENILLEDAPQSFVSKKQLTAKNQKAHVKYLRKKKNKINNATDQHELPKYNQIGEISSVVEAVISNLKNNYQPKGQKWISDFKDVPLSKQTILSYKKGGCKMLSHIRYGKNIDGCILTDGVTKVVGVISVETKNNGQKWIQALEISKEYQGYGLSKQMLDLAVKHYGARYLSVNKNNAIAIKVYEDYGFKKYADNDTMTFMSVDIPIHEYTLLEAVSKDMKPIFIVCSWTNTLGGKVIRTVTNSVYTHSSISFDTGMENLYSFNADNQLNKLGGISREKLSQYIKFYDKCRINVKCIFVKAKDFDIIKGVLDHMMEKQDKTTYDYINLLNIFVGRAKDMGSNAMSMVCSQFVTYILSRADIRLLSKSPNLVTPKDLATMVNPKVYQLYDGLGKEYEKKKIDRIFRKLKQKAVLIKECSL